MVVEAGSAELRAKVVDGIVVRVVGVPKGGRVLKDATEDTGLAGHRLDQHTNGHSRGKGVRIDDNVGDTARLGHGHVFLGPGSTQRTLLSVS